MYRFPHKKKANKVPTGIYQACIRGNIEKHKAHLPAQEYTKTYVIYYRKTFTTVTTMNSTRISISFAAQSSRLLPQYVVRNTFLNDKLKEEIYK